MIPCGRSCHSTVAYEGRYLIVIGGEGLEKGRDGKKVNCLLNDVWVFDTERGVWEVLDVGNAGVFKPRSCFSASLYRNKIIVFGGLISMENFKSSD